jgi:hypothetical protein
MYSLSARQPRELRDDALRLFLHFRRNQCQWPDDLISEAFESRAGEAVQ